MPGKVPPRSEEAFGSAAYPIRQAVCPVCHVLVPVVVSAAGALKGKIVTADHPSVHVVGERCLGRETRVVLPHEVIWPAAA